MFTRSTFFFVFLAFSGVLLLLPAPPPAEAGPSFKNYVDSLYPEAADAGVTWETFEAATNGLTANTKILKFTKSQPEFKRSIGQYVGKRVTSGIVKNGRAMAKKYDRTLKAIERKYGVDRYVVLAIWGMETNYGGYIGNSDTLRSLATLAHAGYRGDYFKKEFINALLVMQQEKLARNQMRGSWAGAVGHTQFMPSSFLKYAVDHNGDGKRDLWRSAPDALASAANYLKGYGWSTNENWGYQVSLPKGIDLTKADDTYRNWVKRGVVRTDGGSLPDKGSATLLFPSGVEGLAFLATDNFMVLKSYNFSDAYALAVGHLADRIANRHSPLAGNWNVERPLNKKERVEMQKKMQSLGYKVPRTDGRIGLEMRAVIRNYQARNGMTPDGHADVDVHKSVMAQ
ncbi:lytic murein transglycosylase [Hoeflea prorocentri]|uniref:Lytic murein transglycosylase n=1 Tax=Hoeflea prorocentri TaxID=1922333 RepID=A0A9X3UQH6_9HYPH|nr:lytic murein transglycosylase [Hoeflea prorocentri]MCY6383509.1 lytic murein transglycosylase [Hoeflea prorocentri]MDA5401309.1 lytic murein transglycosylase [Hoeflea prorocentri]